MDCPFCNFVEGKALAHKIWENERFVAFLSNKPNTPGFAVLIPKQHYPSDINRLPEDVEIGLMHARREVVELLEAAFDDVGRVGFVAEGYGIDHAHLKLVPLHGTPKDGEPWRRIVAQLRKLCPVYEGYILSSDADETCPDEQLAVMAEKIRSAAAAPR